MHEPILYQLRIDLEEKTAKKFNTTKSIQSCKKLLNILEEEKANLICQYEAFSLFVKE